MQCIAFVYDLHMCRLLQVVQLSVNILLMKFFVACKIIMTCNVSMNNRIVKYIFLFLVYVLFLRDKFFNYLIIVIIGASLSAPTI